MPSRSMLNRRRFVRCACGAGTALALPSLVPAAALGLGASTAASSRIQLAAIGLGFGWPMFLRDDGLIEIDARGIFPAEGLFDNPYRWQMHYAFPGGLTWHWTDCLGDGFGSRSGADWPQNRMGITFEGTEGWVFIWRGQVDAHPKKLLEIQIGPRDKVRLREQLPGDFIDCVRRAVPTCRIRSKWPTARRLSAPSAQSGCSWAAS